jgi:alpha-D-xyloside xylohydrolase
VVIHGFVPALDHAVDLVTDTGRIRLHAISPDIVRVVYTARPAFAEQASLAVLPHSSVPISAVEHADHFTFGTGALTLTVDRACGAFTWHSAAGDLLFCEPHDGRDTKILDEIDVVVTEFDQMTRRVRTQGADGIRTVTDQGRQRVDRSAYATTLRLQFTDGEAIYGLGQHEEGIFDYRGHTQDLYQQNLKVAVPVIVSTRGYGIVWDSYSVANFADGPSGAQFCTDVDDELDFYVVFGPDFDRIVAGIRTLTGRVPMLPRWALGYIQSKERYHDEQELTEVVREHRRRHIPLDCIVQDWQSWPDDKWGQKSFDPQRYPSPGRLCAELHAEHARLMVSIWPNMHNDGPDQVAMRERGFLLGDDSTYDARSADARHLYWEQTEQGYFRHGVDAWWADCTEPFEADWRGALKPEPAERLRINVADQRKYLDPEYVSAYSLLHTQGLYEGQRQADHGKRPVVLTRSASLGQQRYGAVTWSGDTSASWEVLRRQFADGMNFCVTGNPRWSFDIGAFFVGRDEDLWFIDGDFPDGVEDAGYRELYVRWLQAATFVPMMRSHGTQTPREPWRFGDVGDEAYDTIVAFIALRYRLLPYLYSLQSWEYRHHYTTMRALAFDFRHDPRTFDVADQFMLGPALMACPVTAPMWFGPRSEPLPGISPTRSVYLPEGSDWYDFWSNRRYRGGQTIEAEAPLSSIPLFIRAGTILALGPPVEWADAGAVGPLEIRVYAGRDAEFEFYEDAGDGLGYERGEFATTRLAWNDDTSTLTIPARSGSFPQMPEGLTVYIEFVDGHAAPSLAGEIPRGRTVSATIGAHACSLDLVQLRGGSSP